MGFMRYLREAMTRYMRWQVNFICTVRQRRCCRTLRRAGNVVVAVAPCSSAFAQHGVHIHRR